MDTETKRHQDGESEHGSVFYLLLSFFLSLVSPLYLTLTCQINLRRHLLGIRFSSFFLSDLLVPIVHQSLNNLHCI